MKLIQVGSTGDDVERWQSFLRGFYPDIGGRLIHDASYGLVTFEATTRFQAQFGLKPDGVVGNATLAVAMQHGFNVVHDPGDIDVGPGWPRCPDGLHPLSPKDRERLFGRFDFVAEPTQANPEAVRMTDGWEKANIITVAVPQLLRVSGGPKGGQVRIHKAIAKQFVGMWQAWDDAVLMDRVLSFNGTFVPRFIRGSTTNLSNHSWGTAMDINVPWNALGTQGALKGQKGSVRELVEVAYQHGFFWGGWFQDPVTKRGRLDPMHVEAFKIL